MKPPQVEIYHSRVGFCSEERDLLNYHQVFCMHNAVRKDFLEILNEESNLQENYEFATHEYFPALFQLFPDSQMDTLY